MNKIYHIIIFLGIAAALHPSVASPQQLEIHCIDVGQGSSELVIGPNGTTILIDGGTSGKGRDEVIPYLDALFSPDTPALDYIIASHDDGDHYGGLNYIIDYSGYSIGTIYHCGENTGFGEGVQIPLGTVIDLGDGARATCVGRHGEFIDGSTGGTTDNNLSVCLLIEYGGFDYITAGDLETNENQLSHALIGYPAADPYLDPAEGVDVIHVNHHGSDGASHDYYINRLKHEVALINGGEGHGYGHPRWTAVDRLKGRATYSDGSVVTGVTWTGCTSVYRTTYDVVVDGRAPEGDCPTLGDIVVIYDGCAENYYVAGMPYPVDEWIVCTTPSPTPVGYHTPSPTPAPEAVYVFNLESDPGWTTDSDWAFGQSTGGGSHALDPSAGYTGSNVYGYNLSGDYPNNLSPTRYLTTTALDCSAVTGVSLRFYRWLGVELSTWDHAGIEMSTNGVTWSAVWENSTSSISESAWSLQTYSLSPGADRAPAVYLRWGMGTTDGSVTYPGWNIDDIEIWGSYDAPTPVPTVTPTPTPTPVPTFTPTPTSTPTPTPVPTFTPTPTSTSTPTPVPTSTPPPTPTPTPTPKPTQTPAPTLTPTPTPAPTPSPTTSPNPTFTPTLTPTPSPTSTPPASTPAPSCGPPVPPSDIVFESGDYDGDGADDIAIFRAASGLWAVRGVTRAYFGSGDDIPVPGDYDGDGESDIGIFRDGAGLWAIQGVTRVYFGGPGDIPTPDDYDGDGSTDIAVFRESTGLWALRGVGRIYFGIGEDWPVPGDYSGSGTGSPAIFRPSSGLWAVRGLTRFYYGADGDWAVPADYDGDGTCNQAVFRGCAGLWAIRGVTRFYHGQCTDYPVRADFNGNGIDSIGVFRESSGLWAIGDVSRVYYGTRGDLPVTR